MANAIQRLESAIEKLETLKAESTHGRWVRGDRWHVAGVMPEFGVNKCCYCNKYGEPTWVGRLNINGRRMKSHVHELDSPYWEHGVYADTGAKPIRVIDDADDADEELIVTLHRTIDAQLLILWTAIIEKSNKAAVAALADAILGETRK